MPLEGQRDPFIDVAEEIVFWRCSPSAPCQWYVRDIEARSWVRIAFRVRSARCNGVLLMLQRIRVPLVHSVRTGVNA